MLKLPYPSIGQCPINYSTLHINQKQMSNFGQFYGFWSMGGLPIQPPLGVV